MLGTPNLLVWPYYDIQIMACFMNFLLFKKHYEIFRGPSGLSLFFKIKWYFDGIDLYSTLFSFTGHPSDNV